MGECKKRFLLRRFLFPGGEKETKIIRFKIQVYKEIKFIASLLRQNK